MLGYAYSCFATPQRLQRWKTIILFPLSASAYDSLIQLRVVLTDGMFFSVLPIQELRVS
jgi:hypothetical protein